MKIEKVFTWAYWDDVGTWGWALQSCPNADPGLGATIAHDVIEHIGDDMTPAGEIKAFGVILYCRGATDYRYGMMYRGTERGVAHSQANELYRLAYVDRIYSDGAQVPKLSFEPDEEEEGYITAYLMHFKETLIDCMLAGEGKDDTMTDDPQQAEKIANTWIAWMRKGYAEAHELYRDHSRARSMFDEVASHPLIAKPEAELMWPGRKLTVTVDTELLEVRATIERNADGYEDFEEEYLT